jgi:hypothetical protein
MRARDLCARIFPHKAPAFVTVCEAGKLGLHGVVFVMPIIGVPLLMPPAAKILVTHLIQRKAQAY